jgi:hypothetical protein
MNYFVIVQVLDSRSNLLSPLHKSGRRDFVFPIPEIVVQRSVGTIFHHNTKYRGQGTDTPELDDVGVVELTQVVDVGVDLVLDLLDRHQFTVPFAQKNSTLSTRTQPLKVRYGFKGNLPVICSGEKMNGLILIINECFIAVLA